MTLDKKKKKNSTRLKNAFILNRILLILISSVSDVQCIIYTFLSKILEKKSPDKRFHGKTCPQKPAYSNERSRSLWIIEGGLVYCAAIKHSMYVARHATQYNVNGVYKRYKPEELSPGRNCFFQRNRTEMGFELDIKGRVLGSCSSICARRGGGETYKKKFVFFGGKEKK